MSKLLLRTGDIFSNDANTPKVAANRKNVADYIL